MSGKARPKKGNDSALSVGVHPHIPGAVHCEARRYRDRREDRGEPLEPGEAGAGGYSYVFERVIAWVLTLRDDDFDRIQREGAQIVRRLRALPDDYQGEPVLKRRADNVFAPARSVAGTNKDIVIPAEGSASSVSDRGLPVRPRRKNPRGERKAVRKNGRVVSPN